MSDSLQPYLPRLVRYWNVDAPGRLHRSIEGSMVLVDISGFTRMSERLARHGKVGAEEVTEVIDSTFAQLLPEAYVHGASLLKFGGDAMLLLFTDEGHARRACAAAVAMRRKLHEIGTFSTTAGKVTLRMSVGVHSGMFDFFLVGESHLELIVGGPAATQTVEMESAANAGQILVSPATAAALPKRNQGKAVGPGILLRSDMEADRLELRAATSPEVDLAPFVPTTLRQFLLDGEVEPEHRPATVAFLHYRGLDELIEREGPETAARSLDLVVRSVQEATDRYEVTFLGTDIAAHGGKIILAAGVPAASGNDEEQMLLALRQLASTDLPLPLSMGVNWGPVFSGEVGPPYRRTYTVMGDTVNLAARLMAKAPPGEIYATAALIEGSRTTFDYTTPEPLFVKGKKLPIQAFSIAEPAGSKAGPDARGLPLIGRHVELNQLLEAWEVARNGQGRVVEVSAEAGIGKSRLLEEFLLTAHSTRLIRSECRLYQSTTPYFPFRSLLRTAWGLEDADPVATETSLRELVKTTAPSLEPWLSLIATPLALNIAESSEVAQLEDQFRPARTLAAIGALLKATATEPTLFVIEDTHWMDDASSALLAGLLLGHEASPWMFVLTRRPGSDGFLAPSADWRARIDLEPLGIEQARQFIRSATAQAPLLSQQVEVLALRAAGSPLFLIELLAALRRGGDVDELPHSVEGMIGARIDKLTAPDRNLLRRLAVLGTGFRTAHMGAVLRDHEHTPRWQRQAMGRLDGFLTRGEGDWIQFRHALIRDAAYEGLPYRTRRELHAQVGDSIRKAAGPSAESQSELLSFHYHQARRWEEDWRYSRVAGDAAKRVYANLEAATFYRRAVTAARQIPSVSAADVSAVEESLGDVLELSGLFEKSVEAYRRAARLSTEPVRSADLMLKRALARIRMGSYLAAARDVGAGRRFVADQDSPAALKAKARIASFTATLRHSQQNPRRAIALAKEAIEVATKAEERDALARAYLVLDAAHASLGQGGKTAYGPLALEIFEELGDLIGIAMVTNNLGVHAYFDGRWSEALEFYTRAQDAFRRAGNDAESASVAANIGEVLVSQGRYPDAAVLLSEAVQVARAHKLTDVALFAEIQNARLAIMTKALVDATALLKKVQDEAAEVGLGHWVAEAGLYIALGRIMQGEPVVALEMLDEVVRRAHGDVGVYESTHSRISAASYLALGWLDQASEAVERGLKAAAEQGLPYERAQLLMLQAAIEEARTNSPHPELMEEANLLFHQLGVIRPQ